MALLDRTAFNTKYNDSATGLFKDNTTRLISEADARSLVTDLKDSVFFFQNDNSDDVDEGVTHLFFTDIRAHDAVNSGMTDRSVPFYDIASKKYMPSLFKMAALGIMSMKGTLALSNTDNYVGDYGLIRGVQESDSVDGICGIDVYSNSNKVATYGGRSSNGTFISRLAIPANRKLVELVGKGYDGSAFTPTNRAAITMLSSELWSGTSNGTKMVFQTTKNTTTTMVTQMTIGDKGNMALKPGDPTTNMPSGWVAGTADRFFEISDNTDGSIGIFARYSDETRGIDQWFETLAGHSYLDNRKDGVATTMNFRMRTAGTPVVAITIKGSGGVELLSRTGYLKVNNLTTTERDAISPEDGMIIYNETTGKFEGRASGVWVPL